MASDYDAITKHNERQLGLDTASRKTQICMYSDSTHFVYELLQNADDYGATEVLFSLSPSSLTIEHNGLPFETENVEAITYFGKSTSRDDLVRAGRFGVGFKSVFAFTATPIIISGSEHFRIHGLYRVDEHPYPEDLDRRRTRIVLPFNHQEEKPDYVDELMSADEAYKKIATRLTGLNMHTLLFTKNIREIRWEMDGQSGHYLREDKRRKDARETLITDGDAESNYLVFARTPTWRNEEHRDVEIAFGLDKKGQLAPIDDYLYVLFATTQETHLQFVINGPYRTNPSRETISEEDAFNRHLMKETCQLFEAVLPDLRDRGLLTTNALGVMPNNTDRLREFYKPLLDSALQTFQTQELVPTDDGKYASAAVVLQGPAPIREVITSAEIAFLAEKEGACWAKGVTQSSRPDQFLKSLEITQWGWQQLEETIKSKYGGYPHYYAQQLQKQADTDWLAARPDDWLRKLYMLLGDAIAKGDCDKNVLQRCRIILVTENKVDNHVSGRSAYFPKSGSYRELPQVKRSVLRAANKKQQKKLEDALTTLGVTEIGDDERIDLLLSTYYTEDSEPVGRDRHLQHMKFFIKWWKKSRDSEKFEDHPIFRTAGTPEQRKGGDCYLDTPLRNSGLKVIYEADHPGVPDKRRLWTRYSALCSEGFCDFAVACGVAEELPVVEQHCRRHPQWNAIREGLWGTRETSTQVDADYDIPSLPALLKLKDLDVNRLIWKTLSKADPEILEARYRPNRQYPIRRRKSSLVLKLAAAEWIPDKKGVLRKPTAMTKDDLHQSFRYDNRNGWLDEIGLGENARRQSEEYKQRQNLAKQLGLRPGIVDLLTGLPENEQEDAQKQIEALLQKRSTTSKNAERAKQLHLPFHEALAEAFSQGGAAQSSGAHTGGRTSRNPGRRRGKIETDIAADIANEPSPETRFIFGLCKKWKGKNDQVRTKLLNWYEGRCQICDRTFTQRNAQPYFEGLYLVPYTDKEWIDRPGNVLCLCPWHSAMFQFGRKDIDTDLLVDIEAFVPRAEGGTAEPVIILTLCGERVSIVFHEDHFLELQTMLRESQRSTS